MCRQVTCSTCGQPTWAGCGAHVEQVLGHIPRAQRCQGHAKKTASTPPKPASTGKGLLAWLGLK